MNNAPPTSKAVPPKRQQQILAEEQKHRSAQQDKRDAKLWRDSLKKEKIYQKDMSELVLLMKEQNKLLDTQHKKEIAARRSAQRQRNVGGRIVRDVKTTAERKSKRLLYGTAAVAGGLAFGGGAYLLRKFGGKKEEDTGGIIKRSIRGVINSSVFLKTVTSIGGAIVDSMRSFMDQVRSDFRYVLGEDMAAIFDTAKKGFANVFKVLKTFFLVVIGQRLSRGVLKFFGMSGPMAKKITSPFFWIKNSLKLLFKGVQARGRLGEAKDWVKEKTSYIITGLKNKVLIPLYEVSLGLVVVMGEQLTPVTEKLTEAFIMLYKATINTAYAAGKFTKEQYEKLKEQIPPDFKKVAIAAKEGIEEFGIKIKNTGVNIAKAVQKSVIEFLGTESTLRKKGRDQEKKGGFTGLFKNLYNKLTGKKTAPAGVSSTAGKNIFDGILSTIVGAMALLVPGFTTILGALSGAVSLVLKGLKVAYPIIYAVQSYLNPSGTKPGEEPTTTRRIGAAGGALAGGITGAIKGGALGTLIAGPIGTVIGGALGGIAGAFLGEKIGANIAEPLARIGSVIISAFTRIGEALYKLEPVVTFVANLIGATIGKILSDIAWVFETLQTGWGYLVKADEWLTGISDSIDGAIKYVFWDMPGKIIESLSNFGTQITDWFAGLPGRIWEGIKSKAGGLLSWFLPTEAAAATTAPATTPITATAGMDEYHKGGMVGQTGPAILQSGERVLNRRQTREYNTKSGGGITLGLITDDVLDSLQKTIEASLETMFGTASWLFANWFEPMLEKITMIHDIIVEKYTAEALGAGGPSAAAPTRGFFGEMKAKASGAMNALTGGLLGTPYAPGAGWGGATTGKVAQNVSESITSSILKSGSRSFANCGDAVAGIINQEIGANVLPRNGLGPEAIPAAARKAGATVMGQGTDTPITLESLMAAGPGTAIRYDRPGRHPDAQYGSTHAEMTAINPKTGQLEVASYSANKGYIWKKIDQNYIDKLNFPGTNVKAANLFPKTGEQPSAFRAQDGALQFTGTTGRSATNNNPLNLEFRGQAGAVMEPQPRGGSRPRFAKFETMQQGYEAGIRQIEKDASRGHTLASFVEKFAPIKENPDQPKFLADYARATGASPDTPLSQIPPEKLIIPMMKRESSTRIIGRTTGGTQQAGIEQQPSAMGGMQQVISKTEPKNVPNTDELKFTRAMTLAGKVAYATEKREPGIYAEPETKLPWGTEKSIKKAGVAVASPYVGKIGGGLALGEMGSVLGGVGGKMAGKIGGNLLPLGGGVFLDTTAAGEGSDIIPPRAIWEKNQQKMLAEGYIKQEPQDLMSFAMQAVPPQQPIQAAQDFAAKTTSERVAKADKYNQSVESKLAEVSSNIGRGQGSTMVVPTGQNEISRNMNIPTKFSEDPITQLGAAVMGILA